MSPPAFSHHLVHCSSESSKEAASFIVMYKSCNISTRKEKRPGDPKKPMSSHPRKKPLKENIPGANNAPYLHLSNPHPRTHPPPHKPNPLLPPPHPHPHHRPRIQLQPPTQRLLHRLIPHRIQTPIDGQARRCRRAGGHGEGVVVEDGADGSGLEGRVCRGGVARWERRVVVGGGVYVGDVEDGVGEGGEERECCGGGEEVELE